MTCLFCDNEQLTKEHIWANWLRAYIPREMQEYSVLKAVAHVDRSDFTASMRKGDIHAWEVRCVCADCNNGWMSQLQVEAKDSVIQLLNGEAFTLSAAAQGSVAAWIAMAIMAGDAGDRQGRAIQPADLRFFRQTKGPPLNWRIQIGDYERGEWPAYWIRHPLAIVDKIEPGQDRTAQSHNAQFTTFVTGRLLAHVSVAPPGTRHLNVSFPDAINRKLRQIWPPIANNFEWPPGVLNDDEADKIAREGFERAMRAGRAAMQREEN